MKMKERIKKVLKENSLPLLLESLIDKMDISDDEIITLQQTLNEMVETGELIHTKKKKYALPEDLGFIVGRLQAHSKGFGFLIPDNPEEEDVFIAAEDIHGAMHNDRIMVRLQYPSTDTRSREGEVCKILERANKRVVGTFEKGNYFGFVVPDDKKIIHDIFIPRDEINGADTDYKVVAEITRWPDKRRNPEGRVVEVLGHKNEVGTDILSIIRQYDLPEEFPEEVVREAKQIPQEISQDEIKRRKDYRDLKIVTIDGADAKDLDDAISLEKLDNGHYLLGVHIADVTYYVRENSNLDKEALERGTSVYLVDRVIPMLPRELSNGICSLNPNEDRLAVSVMMEIDSKGNVVQFKVDESVIRSQERLVYEDVTKILEDNAPELVSRYKDLVDTMRDMEKLSKILRKRRMARGSIDFDLDETKIILDDKGKPIDVRPYERGVSNKIIEEFMLVCNETIAEYIAWSEIPFIYRVHEEPTIEKLLDFNEFIHNFGYHLKGIGGEVHPKALQDLLEKIRGKREEGIISAVMLRSLQKARYSEENFGHFGLAANYYTHFTSPIRRYPDLMIHRIIKEFINNKIDEERAEQLAARLPQLTDHCSQRERIADDAERETDDLKMAEFMLDKIGEEFEGIISGVANHGIYVKLENTIEGMIRISALDDDYYVYNEKHYCLIGERTRKIYRLGDVVQIKVVNVDLAARNIDFILADSNTSHKHDEELQD